MRRKKTKREIVINAERLETRVAVVEDGRLEEFQVEHPTEERIVGSIFKGKIQNLEHDLQAAFVDIGLKKNAFLHYWDMVPDDDSRLDEEENGGSGKRRRRTPRNKRYTNDQIAKRFPPGSEIVVQVSKGPIGTKGPRVTANLSIPGRYLVMMPGSRLKGVSRKIGDAKERQRLKKILDRIDIPEGTGLIVRTAASNVRKRGIMLDLRGLLGQWDDLQQALREKDAPACLYEEPDLPERVVRDWMTEDVDRIVVDHPETYARVRQVAGRFLRRARSRIHLYEGDLPVFDYYGVEKQIEETFRRKVNLKSGGYVIFDETEALVAVDVNTGRHKGKGSQEEAILAVNTEAVLEVARQLRLRNIGGLVLIDLIDMKSRKHQNAVFKEMKASLKRDRARTNVLPISELGIMEMTRQRAEDVRSTMYVDCPYCRGRGQVVSPLGMSVDIQRQIGAIMRKHSKSDSAPDLQVVIHPMVMERLRDKDEEFLVDLQQRFTGKLSFRSDPSRHIESFSILNKATGEALYSSDR